MMRLKSGRGGSKVDIVVERQWHIAPHAQALKRMDALGRVFGGFPRFRYTALGIGPEYLRTNSWPALWNQIADKIRKPNFTVDAPKILARWVARQRHLSRYINCYSTVYRHLFPLLSNRNHILVLERGSTHPEEYRLRLAQAFHRSGLEYPDEIPAEMQDEIEAGHLAHFVVAGSRMIFDSYVTRGYAPERVLLIPYGVDHRFFYFTERPKRDGSIKIACVGIIGARKGLGRLVRIALWAGKTGIPIEIHLIGPLQPEAPAILSQAAGSATLRTMGVKKGIGLLRTLHECDLYCLPSYEEGFGISVLEAMSTGLPAVVSQDTGAREAITHGVDGLVLHNFDDEELSSQFLPLLKSHDLRTEMGMAARRKIETGYTQVHYEDCLIAEYGRMFKIVETEGSTLAPAWKSESAGISG